MNVIERIFVQEAVDGLGNLPKRFKCLEKSVEVVTEDLGATSKDGEARHRELLSWLDGSRGVKLNSNV